MIHLLISTAVAAPFDNGFRDHKWGDVLTEAPDEGCHHIPGEEGRWACTSSVADVPVLIVYLVNRDDELIMVAISVLGNVKDNKKFIQAVEGIYGEPTTEGLFALEPGLEDRTWIGVTGAAIYEYGIINGDLRGTLGITHQSMFKAYQEENKKEAARAAQGDL